MKRLPSNDDFGNLERLLKITAEEALQYWQNQESLEAFRKAILPRMNPFLAMKAFSEIPAIAELLSNDISTSQRELWRRYFNSLTAARTTADETLMKKNIEISDTINFKDEYHNILNMVFYKRYGFENSYRRSYMWLSLLCRLIVKEEIDTANRELLNTNFNSFMLNNIFKLEQLKIIREPIENVSHPLAYNVNLFSYDSFSYDDLKFRKIFIKFLQLSAAQKYVVFQQCPSMVVVIAIVSALEVIFDRTFDNLKMLITNTLALRMLQIMDQVNPFPQYLTNIIFNGGDIYQIFQFHMNIVTTTYPSNPDVGPGIFTGCNICGSKEEFKCNRCEKAVFCGSECFEQHKYKCVN